MQIIHGDGFHVTIRQSKRRQTLAITIKNGEVLLFIPHQIPLAIAQDFVVKNTPWIKKKLQHYTHSLPIPDTFMQGDQVVFLGQPYPLTLIEKNISLSIEKTSQSFLVYGRQNCFTKPAIRAALIHWYKQQAQTLILQRARTLSHQTALNPHAVTLKTYKARWGSCHINGDIRLNWKLVMTPEQVIDYVIIHELCHLKQHNHSPAFWQWVEHYYPDYRSAQQWLKTKGALLLTF